ncbi:MAG: hypothetical protein RLZZ401_557 [Pseudomonadota bacterium]
MSAAPAAQRLAWADALKGLACIAIVWHHLSVYGPMVDVAYPLAPRLVDWLYGYGRMAVQVFLVLAGYLAAASLAPLGAADFDRPWGHIGRRYRRLAGPYLVALTAAVLAAWVARLGPHPASVPAAATLAQALAHMLLLQSLLDADSLSAGVWYIAIDLQLYALTVGGLHLSRCLAQRWQIPPSWLSLGLLSALMAVSLGYFNLDTRWDTTALYFAGSYGMGVLAYWGGSELPTPWRKACLAVLVLSGVVGLTWAFRERIMLAWAVALVLALLARRASLVGLRYPVAAPLLSLGRMSYSVFLIHYPICLLVNAGMGRWWPDQPAVNALGWAVAFVLSLLAARLMHRFVESQPTGWTGIAGLTATLCVAAGAVA